MGLEVWSEFKEQVRSATDLVALIAESRAVIPQSGGKSYKTLCPFHDDRNPSMTIDPARQTYRCWSCNEGGDCFSYVMKLDGLDFRQTIEQLAQRAGLEMPRNSDKPSKSAGIDRKSLLEALDWAAEQYHQCLLTHPEAQAARDYLYDRGFSDETWTDFRLGFHPGPWEWLMSRAAGKFSQKLLETARLIVPRNSGDGFFDFFRARVIFPIHNEREQTIAFGGRAMPGSEEEQFGKYQNSKESFLFNKSQQLYGIERAKQAMRDTGQVIVVEGYTDCIALHQVGISNVVATLGTALTSQHVDLIRRFCQEVTLVFDGDQAGQTAADKALPVLLAHNVDLKLFSIPDGLDPPEYLERYGLQEFQNLLQNASDAWEFKLGQLTETFGLKSDHAKDQIVAQMLQLLAVAPSMAGTSRENYLLNRLANRVGLRGAQEQVLRTKLQTLRSNGPKFAPTSLQSNTEFQSTNHFPVSESDSELDYRQDVQFLLEDRLDRVTRLERDLLEIVITLPECLTLVAARGLIEVIENPILKPIFLECENCRQRGDFLGTDTLLKHFEDPEIKKLILGLADRSQQRKTSEKLQETTDFPTGTVCPILLKQVIEQLEWEHKESHHRNSTRHVEVNATEPTAVDDRLRQLLQDAAQFHKQRVTRKTAST